MEITVTSSGGAAEHQPQTLGRYSRAGAVWEDLLPVWRSELGQYITPDANSNPVIYYVKWTVGDTVGTYDPGESSHPASQSRCEMYSVCSVLMNSFTDGLSCPYEMEGDWLYVYDYNWYADNTLSFQCTQTRHHMGTL